MIVNGVVAFAVPFQEFDQLVVGIVEKWAKAIPNERHVNDRVLVFRNVKNGPSQQLVFVTPENEKTLEELVRKYQAGDYSKPEVDLNVKELLGL
jgi:hypothetical protein